MRTSTGGPEGGRFNAYGLYLWRKIERGRSRDGAFIQLDARAQPFLTLTGRYEITQELLEFDTRPLVRTIAAQTVTAGAQVWLWERLKLAVEHQIRSRGDWEQATIFRVDFIF